MMRPLCELTRPVSGLEAEALALLSSMSPAVPPSGMKRRVRIGLLERSLGRSEWPLRRLIAVTVLLGAAAAGATPLVASLFESPMRPPSPAASGSVSMEREAASSRPPTPSDRIERTAAASTEGVPAVAPEAPRPSAVRAVVARPSPTVDEASRLVFEAMRALRREGQPERARHLLAEHQARYGGSALGEEALALSMEAAVAVGDPQASSLAKRYLKRYPAGHYRETAERIASRP